MPRLLLTGSTGFLGSWILKLILNREIITENEYDTIRLFVRDPLKLKDIKSDHYKIEIFKGNLTDHDNIINAVKDVSAVIHTASLFNIHSSKADFQKMNIDSINIMIEELDSGSKFVLTSSTGVYGFSNKKYALKEDYFNKSKPHGNYQKSKKEQELLSRNLCAEKGIKFTAIRPPAILGPNDL